MVMWFTREARRCGSRTVSWLAAIVVMVLAVGLTGMDSGKANASVGWPQPVSFFSTSLISSPNGPITVTGCGQSTTQSAVVFASTGQLMGTVTTPQSCVYSVAKTGDMGFGLITNHHGETLVSAYQNGVPTWTTNRLTGWCSRTNKPELLIPASPVVGADGQVYVIATLDRRICINTSQTYLVKINSYNGSVVLQEQVDTDWRSLRATANGLLIESGVKLQYFSYGLVRTATVDTQYLVNVHVTVDGYAYGFTADGAAFGNIPGSCNAIGYGPAGQMFTYSVPDCTDITAITVTSNGRILLKVKSPASSRLLSISSTGALVAQWAMSQLTAYDFEELWADVNGNVLFVRRYNNSGAGSTRPYVHFWLLSSDTLIKQQFRTDSIGQTSASWNVSFALAASRLYVSVLTDCPSSCRRQLHAITFAGAGIDYPRGSVLSAIPGRGYASLGDSYSSGEGVEPFQENSPECHRSTKAYARLLDQDLATRLNLTAFVACSGAITDDVVDLDPARPAQHGLPLQMSALSPDIEVVTITIGGNDVGFKEFAEACSVARCDTAPKDAILAQINQLLPLTLRDLYAALDQRLTTLGSSARVYVGGYPKLVRPGGEALPAPVGCVQFTSLERDAILEVTSRLNEVIAAAVDESGVRFVFVPANDPGSPFTGHELCMQQPFFNSVIPTNPVYSYHPNVLGQHAYNRLFAVKIAA